VRGAPPLRAPLALPELGPFALAVGELTALVKSVELRPAAAGRLRFAIGLEIDDATQPITTLSVVAEIEPQLVRRGDGSEIVAGFGPDNLIAARPELGDDAGRAMVDAIARWLPPSVRDHLPHIVVDRAAAQLAAYLTRQP